MRAFVLRRLLRLVPLLFGVVTITFLLLQLAPGDFLSSIVAGDPTFSAGAIEAMRRRFGLDHPWYVQYALYLRNLVLHFDLGLSFSRHAPVATVIGEALGNTLLLAASAAVVTWGLAVPLGALAAARAHSWVDRGLSAFAFLSLSIPEVLSGLLLLMLAARTGWPVGGMHSLDWESLGPAARALDLLRHLALPALVTGLVPLASRMRQMRASLLDVLRLDYVTTARAKGLDERAVLVRHALPNALNPLITLFGYTLGALVSGSFVAEIVFSWPGLGRVTVDALRAQDMYLVLGSVLMASVVLVLGNLIADLMLAASDPRIVHEH